MSQDLQDRVVSLERSNRRWKFLALTSWGVLGLLLFISIVIGGMLARRAHALAVLERDAAEQARQEAREQAEKAIQEEQKQRLEIEKKAKKASMLQLYRADILLARQQWEKGNRTVGGVEKP